MTEGPGRPLIGSSVTVSGADVDLARLLVEMNHLDGKDPDPYVLAIARAQPSRSELSGSQLAETDKSLLLTPKTSQPTEAGNPRPAAQRETREVSPEKRGSAVRAYLHRFFTSWVADDPAEFWVATQPPGLTEADNALEVELRVLDERLRSERFGSGQLARVELASQLAGAKALLEEGIITADEYAAINTAITHDNRSRSRD